MTLINIDELAELTTLDQALLWCIVSINSANLDSRNPYIADNAAIRAESANYIQWNVTQDDKGKGRFMFNAVLPLVNPQPLQDKASILERIWSYSPFAPVQEFDAGIVGYGYGIPLLPDWIDTNERLLSYLGILATLISKYARLTKGDEAFWGTINPEYWASVQYTINDSAYGGSMAISGYMSLDWNSYLQGLSLVKCLNPTSSDASDINCNFPRLDLLWAVPEVDLTLPPAVIVPLIPIAGGFTVVGSGTVMLTENSAGGLLNSYTQKYFNDEELPDWYTEWKRPGPGNRNASWANDPPLGNKDPELIESLVICKEQDPSVISYANQLGNKLPKK